MWRFYKEIDFADENIKQYHIDTRDFHCTTNTEIENLPDFKKLAKYPERFMHSPKEVVDLLDRYYEESGGKLEWRLFTLESIPNWSLKYIRIYRTPLGLIICNKDKYALKKELLESKAQNT